MTGEMLDFTGTVFNFRDAGGVPTADGAAVRPGLLYRSDALCDLAEADREAYAALGIRTVVDLRKQVELDRYGRAPEWACERWHNVPLNNPMWRHEDYSPADGVAAFLVERYHEAARHAADDIVRAVRILADPGCGPAVVHCWGGRDRTGVVIALVLALCGVADADIAADYHRTEQGTARFLAWRDEHRPGKPPLEPYLAGTPAEAMLTFLTQLRGHHGSIEAYLLGAGLPEADLAALRARLRTAV
ncbi:phosphotyrosine protein phosphatase [Catellatospora sp. TT07R-123]|uniref:tyrosine-protein phosphatase n=1 Tax=Catellatospora sp. TT07R-123 TaxID=2733863 RepID=UPI001B0EBE3F|nr:tyrosine-protein phosphatase [Catellatospora sp. TT07R-123]GHJ45115.1 phosphotyrosine protein phosphatase [Catellatospora sp. TT07R-123]